MTIYYQNVRGLRTKTNDLLLNMDASDYDVVVLTETWLCEGIHNSELSSVFNIFRCDRSSRTSNFSRGGGTLIAVKPELRCRSVDFDDCESLEQQIIQINLHSTTLYVCSIYVRPNSNEEIYSLHVNCVQRLIDRLKPADFVVVLGDYNLPELNWELDEELNCYLPINATSDQENILTQSLLAAGLRQINNIININARLLDLAFVSEADQIELFEAPSPLLPIDAHHKPFLLKMHSWVDVPAGNNPAVEYDFKRCDFFVLNRAISSVDWTQLAQESSVDAALDNFYATLNRIFERHVPLKPVSDLPQRKLPWWNKRLSHMKNRLRKAKNKYFASKNLDHKRYAQRLELEYNTLQRGRYRNYLLGVQNDLKQNPASFWKYVKGRRSSNGVPVDITYGERVSASADTAANLFADFFSSVYNQSSTLPSQSYLDSLPTFEMHLPPLNFSVAEVFRALDAVDTTKGAGPDRIPPSFVHNCALSLALPVSIIFNRSLADGDFPLLWKLASIVPVHKSGSTHTAENYRPISILNCLAKTMERLIHSVMYPAVANLISECQHGFVKKRSTVSNLMDFVNMLIRNLEKGRQVDTIYIDFSKAFDKVPHDLVVAKLRRLGFPSWLVDWIRSYLTGRKASVKLHGVLSYLFDIPSGVPQGSIIGPLIFIIFVNDVCGHLTSNIYMYADDLKISRVINSTADCVLLQEDINALLRWCALNGMEVNIRKCKALSFFRTRTAYTHPYHMNATSLERVFSIRDLGVIIDHKARFNDHIAAVTSKAYAMLGFIRRNTQDFDDVNTIKAVYCALVRSLLEYAVQLWSPYHAIHANRIESIQRKFFNNVFRGVLRADVAAPLGYSDRCARLKMETLADRRIFLQRVFVFDVLSHNIDCSSILAEISFLVPARPLRSSQLLQALRHRTDYGYNSPLDTCIRSFNVVCSIFDFNMSKCLFKSRLRRFV